VISNIYIVDVESGEITQLTKFDNAQAETPVWSPNGNGIAFQVVLDGRMGVQIVDLPTGGARPLITESTCCPAWTRK
jgi:Tol biopolymer transport system component